MIIKVLLNILIIDFIFIFSRNIFFIFINIILYIMMIFIHYK